MHKWSLKTPVCCNFHYTGKRWGIKIIAESFDSVNMDKIVILGELFLVFLCVLFLFSYFSEWFCPTSVIFFFSAYLVCLSFSQRTVATIWCLWVIYLRSIWMRVWMVCEWLVVECKYMFLSLCESCVNIQTVCVWEIRRR